MQQATTNSTVSSSKQREYKLFSNGREACDEEYDRVVNAKPRPVRKNARCNVVAPFSILR